MGDSSGWYHVILTTYGAWLYGDARGFRTRHHREHVEGDYKNPPPTGLYERLEKKSREALKQAPVVLTPKQREVVGVALLERLHAHGMEVACVAVGGQHVHLLGRMPMEMRRRWVGDAKRHAWYALRERGWEKKLWGKRSKAIPILDDAHHVSVHRYLVKHAREGAWVWEAGS